MKASCLAVAVTIMLALGSSAEASSPPPLEVARGFWDAYARGDVAGAMSSWDAQRAVRFRNLFEREHEMHCVRVVDSSLRLAHQTPATAVVEIDATVVRTPPSPAHAPRIEEEHYAASLQESAGEWKLLSWDRREELLADELVRTPAGERAATLAAHPALRNGRLAVGLSRGAAFLSNRLRLAEASAILELARGVAGEAGDDAALSSVLAAETVFLRKQPAPDIAAIIRTGEEAERLALDSGDADAIARARMRLARALDYADPPRAERLLLDVLDAAGSLSDTSTIAFAASQLSWMTGARLEAAEAFRYALLALRYADLGSDPSPRMNATFNLAGSYMLSGDFDLAVAYYEKGAAVAREMNAIPAEATALTMIAGMRWPHTADAQPPAVFAQAVELARCGGAYADALMVPLLTVAAERALLRNDLDAARAGIRAAQPMMYRSLAILDERAIGDLVIAEARLLLAGNRPYEALLALEEARGWYSVNPEWRGSMQLYRGLATAWRALGRREEAIAAAREAISAAELERASLPAEPQARELFFSMKTAVYHDLIALLVEGGKIDEALETAEQATSRSLHDVLDARGPRRRARSPAIELAEREVVRLNRTIVTARPDEPAIPRLREQLARARLHLNDVLTRQASLAPPADAVAQQDLDPGRVAPGTAILRYVVADTQTIVLAARRSERGPAVTAHVIPLTRAELQTRVQGFLARLEARDLDYGSAASALHRLLVEPLLPGLGGVERLSIVPDDPLWQLPFQTLRDADGRSLVDRFEVSYAPSVSWCLRDDVRRRPDSILAVGDPEIDSLGRAMVRALVPGSTLGRLPDAAREAREVGRLYPRSRVLTGRAAAESVLKDEIVRYDIVHLATHALIDEAQPRYSSIVLATPAGSEEDGLLEARELEFLDLDAQLVVLSACNTARGRGIAGEGVVGLAWALLSRGVRHAVVSQWKADSKATTALMVAFHRHLTSGHSPAAALRKAQLELRRNPRYEDPLYWAPFIVIGPS